LHLDDQINLCQVVKCEISKQDHIESFVIELFIDCEGACTMSVGFLTGVSSTCASQDDYAKLMGPNYGSFGLPSSIEKVDDQVNSSFVIVDIIFVFFSNLFTRIIVFVLNGLFQFCLWF
jgi:hypothetical protein